MLQALTSLNVSTSQGAHIEINFSLVGRTSFDALPRADELLSLQCDGERLRSLSLEAAIWRSVGPRHNLQIARATAFADMAEAQQFFAEQIAALATEATRVEGRLMPGGMHPWLAAPCIEAWPHGDAHEDEAMHRLFGMQRHGWGNQQPLSLSLGFSCEAEFALLYSALRFLLPLLPLLSAASPFAEGRQGPALQCRVGARQDLFRSHTDFALTSVQRLVPPAMRELAAFETLVVAPLQKALRRNGVAGSLRAKDVCATGLWLNRQAGTLSLGLLDGQECLQSTLAVCAAIPALASQISHNSAVPSAELDTWPAARLSELAEATVRDGADAIFRDADYLATWGFPEGTRARASELIQFLWEDRLAQTFPKTLIPAMELIATQGPLASRLLRSMPPRWNAEDLFVTYRRLCQCVEDDRPFVA